MSRFLFTVWPFPGHVNPNVAVAHALCDRGHEVAFYTDRSVHASLEREGFRCFPFRNVDGERAERLVLTLDAHSLQWWKARRQKALLREWLVETAEGQIADVEQVCSIWRPDALVCDPAMWGPVLVTQEARQVPLAILSYVAACMLPGPEGPIIGLPLPRAVGPVARAGRRVLRMIQKVVAADVRRAADDIRRRHGLSPIGMSVTEFAGRAALYLVPSTPTFDRQRHDLPDSVQYVGPCQWDRAASDAPPAWLAGLSRDLPIVYVTEGSLHSKPPLVLRAALEGLASMPVQVVATTGRYRDPQHMGLGPIPSNARVERWIPHSDLLPLADVVVTTGGTGTVMAALSATLPLVVVPTAWDQPENAWRVEEAGAGIRVAPRKCTPQRVRDAVSRVLDQASFRENARRLAADFSNYRGAAQAAALLGNLVAVPAWR